MAVISIRDLLEAGAHFGHQTSRWNPKMKKYIFEERNGVHIVDLEQTKTQVEKAYEFISNIVSRGGQVLFVGTKRQAKEIVQNAAANCGMYYVNERWLGGTLTNIQTIRKSVDRLTKLENLENNTSGETVTKKEFARIRRERLKLEKNLGGIRSMTRLPKVVFIVDPVHESIAVLEANKLRIPIIALVDTNCDPDLINIPIVCNDDAVRTIALITDALVKGVQKAKMQIKEQDFAKAEAKKIAEELEAAAAVTADATAVDK